MTRQYGILLLTRNYFSGHTNHPATVRDIQGALCEYPNVRATETEIRDALDIQTACGEIKTFKGDGEQVWYRL